MDREKILDKMRDLRDARDNELIDKNKDNIRVTSVKYIGTIDYNGEKKQIYLLEEQIEKEDGSTVNIERYYTEDGEFLGGNNNADQYDYIILDEKHLNETELLEELEELDKDGELDLNELEDERLEEIALTLGIDKEHIKAMSEIDADQLIKLKEEEKEPEDKTDANKNEVNEEKETISKKQMEKVSAKNEIATNQKVTDKITMAELLHVTDKGYKKFAIVYSDNFKDSGNTTRFSIVGIKEDGSAEKIDTLEQGYGKTPTKNIYSLNRDGSEIEEEQVNSIFKIKGRDEEQVGVRVGAMGTIEASLIRTPVQDNQKAVSIPIETRSVKPTTRETREYINKQKNRYVNDDIERAENLGSGEHGIKCINDNPYDDPEGHNHNHEEENVNNTDMQVDKEEIVEYVLEEDTISYIYNRTDIENNLEKFLSDYKKEGLDEEEVKEGFKAEMLEKAAEEHEPQRTRK